MICLALRLSSRLPFFYGWVVLACVCCTGFSRQGPAVATLSIFVEPMTEAFGWSRTAISGAVSVGGVLAAVASPLLGPLVDRHGARAMLCTAVLATGIATALLSQVDSLVMFYVLFCFARMNFAGPYDLGIYGAITSWFVRRRATAAAVATLAQMAGLTAMPLIAYAAMAGGDWRAGWLAVGATVLVVGFLPTFLLLVRRPEDMGLEPDGAAPPATGSGTDGRPPVRVEPQFTRAEAMRTPAFWLLSGFTLLAYPVQAGVSLHQAPHLLERGLDPAVAATVVSTFSLLSGLSGLLYGAAARRLDARWTLAASGVFLAVGSFAMTRIGGAADAYLAAALFGLGIGGVITILPIAWADFFGRRSYGAIRGVALSVQVSAQAAGPVASGLLRDLTGDYSASLALFTVLSGLAAVAILFARTPAQPRSGKGG